MSELLPASAVPGRTPLSDDSTCQLCGHEWHGLECHDPYGPTATTFPWPSRRGQPCGCRSSFVEEPEPTMEPPC